MRTHTIYDARTGETTVVPFTPEEEAEWDARDAEAEQAELDFIASLPEATKEVIRNDPKLAVIADALYEVAKAAKTGNWSNLTINGGTPVQTKADFLQYLVETYRRLF